MLIETDIHELGDKRLSPEEGIAQQREKNKKLIDAKKLPGQSLLENQGAARGTPMEAFELIRRICLLNSNIIVEPGGWPGAVAVRVPTIDEDTGLLELQYVTGFMLEPALPEYTYIKTDERGLPKSEVRGWRNVLETLRVRGLLTAEQIKKNFGDPLGFRSEQFQKFTKGR